MSDFNQRSRLSKFEKRRSHTKLISILIIVASILLLILLAIWIFGGKDEKGVDPEESAPDIENAEKEDDPDSEDNDTNDSPENDETDDISGEEPESDATGVDEDQDEHDSAVEIKQIAPSDDNVSEAYTGDWQAIKTAQEGPHTTDYADGSQDRIEIKQAIMLATGLDEDLRTWWVGNGGDQKVVATVSDHNDTKTYRVYLSWIDNEGWQPTMVEILKENDKKKP